MHTHAQTCVTYTITHARTHTHVTRAQTINPKGERPNQISLHVFKLWYQFIVKHINMKLSLWKIAWVM